MGRAVLETLLKKGNPTDAISVLRAIYIHVTVLAATHVVAATALPLKGCALWLA
jgi:hypothetical protein